MPKVGDGFRFLRDDDRHFALPRFAKVIAKAALRVERARPGGTLVLGDLSRRDGGQLLPHLSHRTGRDADLIFYATTLEGAPVPSPGFVHYGPDGLAWDESQKRFLRLDVEREWLLVKALIEDEDARVQWLFVSRNVRSILLEWARARGEPTETLYRAVELMAQPTPGGVHDDHIHVRTACGPEDRARGCEHSGAVRPWLLDSSPDDSSSVGGPPSNTELALLLLAPFDSSAGTLAPSATSAASP
jgi:penicillin-insensitive murein DD-endopeptidase